jgi:4-diphosphocytidyl-2-C-methyl-D-erythritol kinase
MPPSAAEPVVLRAPAKLTLRLRITGVRGDGFHLLDAEMVTLDLFDVLTIDPAGDGLEVVDGRTGRRRDGAPDDLVRRALASVDRRAGIRLEKHVPPGAGLGGGSADAAAILRWAGATDLVRAGELGADIPFCVVGGRARVTGIGEVVEPLAFERRVLTLATPPFGCSTPAVYRRWDELGGPSGDHGNDLEPAALDVEPRLAAVRDALGDATGSTPQLAGSGSTWFVEGEYPGDGRVVVRTTPAGWPSG